MVGEISKVTELFEWYSYKTKNNKEIIEKKNNNADAKLYHMDSIKNDKLEELIQLYAKINKHKKDAIPSKIAKKKEAECENKIIEKNIRQEDSQSSYKSNNNKYKEENYDDYDDDIDFSYSS